MTSYLQSLNPEQLKPVLCTEGAVLVLAGAGSGKTRVLTTRIAHLILDKNIAPYNILAITFTNKAANEMKQRIEKMTGQVESIWVSTIHSMCVRILRMFIENLGFNKNFSIYTEQETTSVLKKILQEKNLDPKEYLKSIRNHISNAKNINYSIADYRELNRYKSDIDIVCQVFSEYQDYLKRTNALDFDDLLIKTLELLKTSQEAREYLQNKFRYIHIDEFQDTNDVQYEIVKILSGKHNNLFAVGDDDQSIYGWRGANISNILNFEKDFKDANVFKLEQNYRSTKNILECANNIIRHNVERKEKTLWTENEGGVKVEIHSAKDEQDEAYYVASHIRNLINRGYNYSDFAVLMRINALSAVFEQEFLKYGIPNRMFGGFKFFERKEIKDILSYFLTAVNEKDEQAILRSINTPKRGIGDTLIEKLQQKAQRDNIDLFQAVNNIESCDEISTVQKSKIVEYRRVINDIKQLNNTRPLDAFIDDAVILTNIASMYMSESEEDYSKRMNIDQLINLVKEFGKLNPSATLSDYIQSVTLSSDLDSAGDDDNKVTLATIHAAKGLEFKTVFIVGLEEGILPTTRSIGNDELQEERRLMYVAVTRARQRLYLTRARQRYLYGQRNITVPSRFLKDAMIEDTKIKTESGEYIEIQPRRVAEPLPNNNPNDFTMGICVIHKVFGEGMIVNTSGENSTKKIDVAFKGLGVKQLDLRYAPIKIKE